MKKYQLHSKTKKLIRKQSKCDISEPISLLNLEKYQIKLSCKV